MITTRCLMLMVLVKYVSPIPLSKGENEDIQVMKCIVEVIADALSRPHPLPVNQHCLDTLRTDERLVSILRHRNFLKELQDIAEEGASERAQQSESQASMTGQETKLPQNAPEDLEANPDRSMLLAGLRPGEKRAEEEEEEEEEPESTEREATESQESQEGNEIEGKEQERSKEEQNPSNRISDSMNQEMEREEKEGEVAEKEKEEEGEGEEEEEEKEKKKQSSSEEEEGDETVAKNGKVSVGPGDTSEAKPASAEEDKRTALDSAQEDSKTKRVEEEVNMGEEEEEEEKKRGIGAKRWSGLTHQPRGLQVQRRAKVEQEEVLQQEEEEEEEERRRSSDYQQPQEVPHHSKEESHEEEEEAQPGLQRSPEERELRMMAKREQEDRREEEGSASRKAEEPEMERIESLAAIESELVNVAQKLHELRRG